jgi:hypothetical protein
MERLRGKEPIHESRSSVAERSINGLTVAGAETVERDRKIVDTNARHNVSLAQGAARTAEDVATEHEESENRQRRR